MTHTAPPLRRLVRVELRKTIDTRAGRWLLGLVGVVSIGTVILFLVVGHDADQDFADFLYTAQLPLAALLPVLGILTMTSEWSQRTALTTFAMVPRRSRVIGAKLLGLVVLALILVAAAVVTATVATLIAHAGGNDRWGAVPTTIGRVVLLECLVVFVGAAFGLALLNAPTAIVGFLLLPSVLTGLVSLIPSLHRPVMWLDLVTNTTNLLGEELTAGRWGKMAVSIVVWGVLPFVFGTIRVRRRDVS